MKKSDFESELARLDKLMQQDLKKSERKRIVERLEKLMEQAEKLAGQGELSKETALRMRVDLCHLARQVKKNDQDKKSSRKKDSSKFGS